MYYEIYIDVFFFVNFIMNFFVLSVSKKILKCSATYGSICLGAIVGALMTTVLVVAQIECALVKIIIFHGVISILMIRTGLKVKGKRNFIIAYVTVYISAFLIGGIFSSFEQYMREGSIFFVFAIISYIISTGIWKYMVYMGKCRNIHCEVLLINGMKRIKVNAIIDTGNRLRDTVTGKPVCIISKNVADVLWQEVPKNGMRYISYHTIGKKDGILPLFLLDGMCLYLEEEIWLTQVLVAISDETIGTGKYDVILSPDIR